jgi:phosphoribosylamine--glycine ligase
MRVLLIGNGGREHALAVKLRASPLLSALFAWPGHALMADVAEPLPDVAGSEGFPPLIAAARAREIDLVVVGPETPLADGLADALQAAGFKVFGPVAAAARLEADKAFAKEIMQRAGIPTAAFSLARGESECRAQAEALLARTGGAVIKASGLAAGKGVFVCHTQDDIGEALARLYHTDMRAAAAVVVIEELLVGRECSHFASLGALAPVSLGFAVDHKRRGDGDVGPNTGGMGCYAPVPWLPLDADEIVRERVIEPLRRELARRGLTYTGWLYTGLMWGENGPAVVEFNVRLGDPEAEVLAVLDPRDWLAVAAAQAGLPVPESAQKAASAPLPAGDAAVCVVMVSPGYPYERAVHATQLPRALLTSGGGASVFGASIAPGETADAVLTGSGRVLCVAARARGFAAARRVCYERVAALQVAWPAAEFRHDIAAGVAAAEQGERTS